MSIFTFSNNPIEILDTHDAIGLGSGGSLTIDGGASIAQDVFIGGFIDAAFNAHTIGSLFITGGNLGISKIPTCSLDVSGLIRADNLTITNATIGSFQPLALNNISNASGIFLNTEPSFIIRSGQNSNQTDTITFNSGPLGKVTELYYKNNGANSINIAGGSGVTLNGSNQFSPGSTHKISVIISGESTAEAILL
jgi:hypothetical protein